MIYFGQKVEPPCFRHTMLTDKSYASRISSELSLHMTYNNSAIFTYKTVEMLSQTMQMSTFQTIFEGLLGLVTTFQPSYM